MACPFCEPGLVRDESLEAVEFFHRRGVHLSPNEAICLSVLMKGPGIVRSTTLINYMWGSDPNGGPDDVQNNLKVYISKCRHKIKQAKLPWDLRVIHGTGYVLEKTAVSLSFILLCIFPLARIF